MLRNSAQHAAYLIWELEQIFNRLYCDVNLSMVSNFKPYEHINNIVKDLRGE
jgi:hypothetical protein